MGRAVTRPVDPTERVRELTWAMVDDHMEDSEWGELQKLLFDSSEARFAYIEAIQLHTDLLFHFRERHADDSKATEETPILGSVGTTSDMSTPSMGIGS